MNIDWCQKFNGAITVCDKIGTILYMNEKAIQTFMDPGDESPIGHNLFDCHPEPAKAILKELMSKQKSNCYTIEKKGKKKLIYQSPWYENGEYKGFVEISLEIPFDLPNKIRV